MLYKNFVRVARYSDKLPKTRWHVPKLVLNGFNSYFWVS